MALRNISLWIGFFALLAASTGPAWSDETDQFTGRDIPLRDTRESLNARINERLQQAAATWKKGEDNEKFAEHVRKAIDGYYLVHKVSPWASGNPDFDHVMNFKSSIYRDVPFYKSVVKWPTAMAVTVNVAGVRTGVDKLSHMFYVGWQYYRKFMHSGKKAALRIGPKTEKGILGWHLTGVYSNADIVANVEGFHFYRGLFEDAIVGGKAALFRWENGKPIQQREFDIADHVNAYWDESINTGQFNSWVLPYVRERILSFCEDYRNRPETWGIPAELDEALTKRYEDAGLWDNHDYRLESICAK